MGMGEPLHNLDAVHARAGHHFRRARHRHRPVENRHQHGRRGARASCAWPRNSSPYRLAVSLHGSTEEERAALVPASRRWPLEMLIDACRDLRPTHRQADLFRVDPDRRATTIRPETAARLAKLLEGIDAHINLIPLNPTGGFCRHRQRRRPRVPENPARRRISLHLPPAPRHRRGGGLRHAQVRHGRRPVGGPFYR